VNITLPEAAVWYGDAARRAITKAGGVDVARRAQSDPEVRLTVAGRLTGQLDLDNLDIRAGLDETFAGAQLCRVAGRYAFPFPVAAALAAPRGAGFRFLALTGDDTPWIEHADLTGGWAAIDPAGITWRADPAPTGRDRTIAPFVTRVALRESPGQLAEHDRALALCLDSWRILGAVEAAADLAAAHVAQREQFGQPLAKFQGVRFHIADCLVAVRGLRQLAYFTIWRAFESPDDALVDALALRVYALEAAGQVLTASHQLLGAMGFCDEHDLSVVDRWVQAPLRLPTDIERTTDLLAAVMEVRGFDGLFDPRSSPPVEARRA
jgi:acyl-CoA dehydrogenase